jgi:hypothetical protein
MRGDVLHDDALVLLDRVGVRQVAVQHVVAAARWMTVGVLEPGQEHATRQVDDLRSGSRQGANLLVGPDAVIRPSPGDRLRPPPGGVHRVHGPAREDQVRSVLSQRDPSRVGGGSIQTRDILPPTTFGRQGRAEHARGLRGRSGADGVAHGGRPFGRADRAPGRAEGHDLQHLVRRHADTRARRGGRGDHGRRRRRRRHAGALRPPAAGRGSARVLRLAAPA